MLQIGYWLFGLESISDVNSVKSMDHLSPDILTTDIHVTDATMRQGICITRSDIVNSDAQSITPA